MKTSYKLKGLLLITALAAACSSAQIDGTASMGLGAGPPARQTGLLVDALDINRYADAEAGESTKQARAYSIAPPVVPHDVSELELTRGTNDCIDCHASKKEQTGPHDATRIPESHYVNPFTKDSTEAFGNDVVGNRYECLQCHLPQTGAKLTVDNPNYPVK